VSGKLEIPQPSKAVALHSTQLLGAAALTLWAVALCCVGAAVGYAFDRDRVRLFTLGLLMVDLSMAVLTTLIWYLAKYYLRPQAETRAIGDYMYRAGYRDATMKYLGANADLHLVQPPTVQVPAQPPRGSTDAISSDHRAGKYVG